MKTILDSIFNLLYGKRKFYGFFYFLYLRGLKGIEQGYNYGMVETSGERNVIELLNQVAGKRVVFDGGANKGIYSLFCAEILRDNFEIHAFEPSKVTYETLKKSIAKQKAILPINLALSDVEQDLVLYSDAENSGIASVVDCDFEHYGLVLNLKETIKATTVDEYCKKNSIGEINLLKLDLEGYELTALRGSMEMINTGNVEMIQFEMGRPNIDSHTTFKDFFNLLKDKYTTYRILSFGFSMVPVYSYENELYFGSNYISIRKDSKIKIPHSLLIN
ncbi:MAG: FkbM family methyltransferase [Cytophagales bacterium]|nr:FkbM family methyltransferase [Cytophagales bacterium]